ncbi:MAG: hypothetical protein LC637_10675 [Xanthomonadaceae bacterium]|nr:hypothetical protein [Xanthomonadaceae bacterium]
MKYVMLMCAAMFTLCLLTLETVNAQQKIYYEVQLDIFESNKRTASPYVIVEDGKLGLMTYTYSSGDELHISVLANNEGVVNGEALVSLSLELSSLDGIDKAAETSGVKLDKQATILMAPTVFVKSTEAIQDPMTLSKGDVDVVASIRRVPFSEIREHLRGGEVASCASPKVSDVANQEASIQGSSCCDIACDDGGIFRCCGVAGCSACGGSCRPQENVGF